MEEAHRLVARTPQPPTPCDSGQQSTVPSALDLPLDVSAPVLTPDLSLDPSTPDPFHLGSPDPPQPVVTDPSRPSVPDLLIPL